MNVDVFLVVALCEDKMPSIFIFLPVSLDCSAENLVERSKAVEQVLGLPGCPVRKVVGLAFFGVPVLL